MGHLHDRVLHILCAEIDGLCSSLAGQRKTLWNSIDRDDPLFREPRLPHLRPFGDGFYSLSEEVQGRRAWPLQNACDKSHMHILFAMLGLQPGTLSHESADGPMIHLATRPAK